ncbi:hypothetical protein C8258_04370 [Nocardia sp. MDA0666]|nr:hypothetical protein C8258_04370 [Nocardia sp. MDA0666]
MGEHMCGRAVQQSQQPCVELDGAETESDEGFVVIAAVGGPRHREFQQFCFHLIHFVKSPPVSEAVGLPIRV